MCGFAGVINNSHSLSIDQITVIADKVKFRGPDHRGIRVFDENWMEAQFGPNAFFFNRLAIVDLDARSNQPFEDDTHLLLFNGEIYNYHDLKRTLLKRGCEFATTSDTEVLFYALKIWGKDALRQLNGMFAFCWVNKKSKQFLLARDRIGIKPLYYFQQNGFLSFGSELHSLLRITNLTPKISAKAAHMYLWMQYVPTPYTIIDGINKLPPGCYIEGNTEKLKKRESLIPISYWNAYQFVNEAGESWTEDLETVLKNSLERQLHADVPLGLFLSSGIDSSLLAALVNKYFASKQEFNFFTVCFDQATTSDESSDAISFISGFKNPNLHSHKLHINASYIHEHVNDLYKYYDEPFGDHASLLNWVISKKARDYVTVAISGDGSDELFWGYPRYNRWQKITQFNNIPFMADIANTFAKLLPESNLKYKLISSGTKNGVQRHLNQFLPNGFRFFLNEHIFESSVWSLEGTETLENRQDLPAILDLKTYLADAMLYKVDRASMASSLEVRVPFLDNEVIDFALRLPLNAKSNKRFQNKALPKDLLMKLASHYNIEKPKKGFNFPLQTWLQNDWKEEVHSLVTSDMLQAFELDHKKFLSIVYDFYNKKANYTDAVWYLYNLALWRNNFINLMNETN